jgi:hypothetical protein
MPSFLIGVVVIPVEILTSEQESKCFWFDDQDRMIIFKLRGDYNCLGFAIQLGTVRFLGVFLSNPLMSHLMYVLI